MFNCFILKYYFSTQLRHVSHNSNKTCINNNLRKSKKKHGSIAIIFKDILTKLC